MVRKLERYFDAFAVVLFFVIPVVRFWGVISRGRLMVYGDGLISIAMKLFPYQNISSGEWPLWNQYSGVGTPFFSDTTTTFFYPFNALALLQPPALFSNVYYLLHVGLAGLFTYLFLRQNENSKLTALFGGIVFSGSLMLGGSRREHLLVYSAIVWLPLILFFIQRYIVNRRYRYLIFAAFAMALQYFGGHLQYVLYTDILAFCYLIYQSVGMKFALREVGKAILLWIAFYILFIAIALIPLFQLFMQSDRGNANYFSLYSINWKLLIMTLFPFVFGNDLTHPLGPYGSAEISIEIYLGIIILIYAFYAVRYHFNNRIVRFGLAAIIISLVWSAGPNIAYLSEIVKRIPILNLFGVQSRALFIFGFFIIVCSAIGIADIGRPEYLRRLLSHAFLSLLFIVAAAILVWGAGISPVLNKAVIFDFRLSFDIFGISISLAVANLLLISLLYLLRNNTSWFLVASNTVLSILLIITLMDIGRFAQVNFQTNFDDLVNTRETVALKKLLQGDPYRVMVIYDQIYGGAYQKSGLVDNWSIINKIRNIKGFYEFENERLNELLDQTESRDNHNGRMLVSKGDILSMLAVKYVLIPLDEPGPAMPPSVPEAEVVDGTGTIEIPGNGELFVQSFPVSISARRYYQIDFDLDAQNTDVQLFYTDLYGGSVYDYGNQDKAFVVRQGDHHYSGVISSGLAALPKTQIFFRLVAITSSPLKISNLKVSRLAPSPANPDYVLVDKTRRYKIYENNRAQQLLYIPAQVRKIADAGDLRAYPDQFPQMDKISYVAGLKDYFASGVLSIESIKNNSVRARISSQNKTFLNHAQSYNADWTAYVDGKPTTIYLVNGVMQGIEVPAGEHEVEFRYSPVSLIIGAAVTFLGYALATLIILFEKRTLKNESMKNTFHDPNLLP